MRRKLLCTALAAASTLLLSACGDSGSDSVDSGEFDKNRAVYALPLDQFRAIDIAALTYAANLIVQPCMQEAGYEWPIPPYHPSSSADATTNSAGRRLFDPSIAQRYGYHLQPSARPEDDELAVALNSRQLSPAEEKARDLCFKERDTRLPLPSGLDLADSLAGAAYDAARFDDETLERAQKWRTCMEPYGISDLPDAPIKMPSPSLDKRFQVGGSGTSASPEEIEIATADARCRESSGYAQQIYDVEFLRQLEAVAQNRDSLDRARGDTARLNRVIRSIIAEHGS
jgi:hypothetical protein